MPGSDLLTVAVAAGAAVGGALLATALRRARTPASPSSSPASSPSSSPSPSPRAGPAGLSRPPSALESFKRGQRKRSVSLATAAAATAAATAVADADSISAVGMYKGLITSETFVRKLSSLGKSQLVHELQRTYDVTQALSQLLALSNKISGEAEIDKAVTGIIDMAYLLCKAESISMFLVDHSQGDLVLVVGGKNPGAGFQTSTRVPFGQGLVGHVAQWGETVNVADVTQDPRFHSSSDTTPVSVSPHSMLCVPVRDHLGRIVGVLQAANKIHKNQVSSFTHEDKCMIELVASCTGSALNKLQQLQQQTLVHRLVVTLAGEIEPDRVIDSIIDTAYQLLGVDRVTLFLVDRAANELCVAVSKDAEGFRVPMGKGVAGWVATHGETVNIANAYADDRFDRRIDTRTGFRTKSILCVPVRNQHDEIVAVLQCLNKYSGVFQTEDEALLLLMAAHAGVTLWKSQLYTDTLREQRKSQALLDVVQTVTSASNVNALVDGVIQCLYRLLDADRVSLLLVDPIKRELWTVVSKDVEGIRIPLGIGIAGHVAVHGAHDGSVVVDDVYNDARFDPSVDRSSGYRTKSMVCVPVVSEPAATTLAVIQAINKGGADNPSSFTTHDVEMVELMAREVAGALERRSLDLAYAKVLSDAQRREATVTTSFIVSYCSKEYAEVSSTVHMRSLSFSRAPRKWPSGAVAGVDFRQWTFNALEKTEEQLMPVIEEIFCEVFDTEGTAEQDTFTVDKQLMRTFLLRVREKYRENPFHNFLHAFSVLHAAYLIIITTPIRALLDRLEIFGILLCALCHDLDHPGTSNNFLIASRSPLALQYNDISVLENHHAATMFSILAKDEANVLAGLSKDQYSRVRKTVIGGIMATDMAHHSDLVAKLKSVPKADQAKLFSDRQLLVNAVVHTADLSGQALPWDAAKEWGSRVIQEFKAQVHEEQKLGLPSLPFMAKLDSEADRGRLQLNFIDFVVRPLFDAMTMHFGELDPLLRNLDANRAEYAAMVPPDTPTVKTPSGTVSPSPGSPSVRRRPLKRF